MTSYGAGVDLRSSGRLEPHGLAILILLLSRTSKTRNDELIRWLFNHQRKKTSSSYWGDNRWATSRFKPAPVMWLIRAWSKIIIDNAIATSWIMVMGIYDGKQAPIIAAKVQSRHLCGLTPTHWWVANLVTFATIRMNLVDVKISFAMSSMLKKILDNDIWVDLEEIQSVCSLFLREIPRQINKQESRYFGWSWLQAMYSSWQFSWEFNEW